MGKWHAISGVLCMLSWMVMIDGSQFALQDYNVTFKNGTTGLISYPFKFVDSLPGLFCMTGLILFAMTNLTEIVGPGDEDSWSMMGGGGGGNPDETAPLKARILFFIAASFMLAGMTVSIWQLAGTRAQDPSAWPAWSLLLQVFVAMSSAFFLCLGNVQAHKQSDEAAF